MSVHIEGPPRIYSESALREVLSAIAQVLVDPQRIEGVRAVIPFEFNGNFHRIEVGIR